MPTGLRLVASLLALAFLAGCQAAPVQLYEAGSTAQPAVIMLPEQLEVAMVNGQEIEGASGMLTRGDKTLELAPGTYELVVFYRELWEWSDHHEVLRSDPALFRVTAAPGGRYKIDYARPANLDEARELAGNFSGWVEDLATRERTASTASGLQFQRSMVPTGTFDNTLVPAPVQGAGGEQVVAPLETGIAAAPVPAPGPQVMIPVPVPVPAGPAAAPAAAAGDWLDLMKSWWNQASSEERREFLRWLAEPR